MLFQTGHKYPVSGFVKKASFFDDLKSCVLFISVPLGIRLLNMQFSKISRIFIFVPFFVATAIVVLGFFLSQTGISPDNHEFACLALAAISAGLLLGGIAVFLAKSIWVWWRVLAGVLYVPTTIFSLVAAGF